MRAFIKLNYLVKFVVIAISSVALVYETSELASLYYRYPTVVNVKLEKEMIIELPSMTICVSTLLTRSALMARYGKQISAEMAPIGPQAHTHHKDRMDCNHCPPNATIDAIEAILSDNGSKILDKYSSIAVKQLSISNLFSMSAKESNFISCNLSLPLVLSSERGFGCQSVSEVIESFNSNGKCFTYFSRLNQNLVDPRLYKVSLFRGLRPAMGGIASIRIEFPLEEYTNYWDMALASIAIHPPNMVPNNGKVHKLRPGFNYDIYFSKTLSKLLPPPYETMCTTYQTNDPDKPQSRADCVDKCVIEVWTRLLNCTPLHISVRRDVHHLTDYLCGEEPDLNNSFAGEMKNSCYDRCLPDCIDEEYDFDVEETYTEGQTSKTSEMPNTGHASKASSVAVRSAHINLIRRFSGDVTYNHTPQMPFIEFICYVGSLASLWLGLSVLAIYDYLTKLSLLLYLKYQKLKTRNKTKIRPKLNNVFVV